jgi:hypothetical protein
LPILKIPADDRKVLLRIAALSESDFQQLLAAVNTVPVRFDPVEVAATLSPLLGFWNRTDLQLALMMLMTLYSARDSRAVPIEQFISDVSTSVEQQEKVDPSRAETLKNYLRSLLSVGSLELASKVAELSHEHANLFESSRILTDVRPVFGADSSDLQIQGAVIINTLKIRFWNAGGSQEVYVSLDEEDLEQLRDTVARALNKNQAVRALMTNRSIPDLQG